MSRPLRGVSRRSTAIGLAVVAALCLVYAQVDVSGEAPASKAAAAVETEVVEPPTPPEDEAESEEVQAAGEEGEEDVAEETRKRQEWFDQPRLYPSGAIPAHAWGKAHAQATALRRARRAVLPARGAPTRLTSSRRTTTSTLAPTLGITSASTAPLSFREIGPHPIARAGATTYSPYSFSWEYGGSLPYSGRITTYGFDPRNAAVVYAGTGDGGVWRSADSGATWSPFFDNAPAGSVPSIGQIVVDPLDSATVYVGTGQGDWGIGVYAGTGLYRTTDGGASWARLGGTLFDQCVTTGLVVSPTTPRRIAIAVHGYRVDVTQPPAATDCVSARSGIYVSTDGGSSFGRVLNGRPSSLVAAPNNPSVVFAGYETGQVWRSTQGGLTGTWAQLGGGLPAANSSLSRVTLSVVPSRSLAGGQTIYAAIATTSSTLTGIYRSDNSGASWSVLPGGPSYGGLCVSSSGQCNYDLAIAADPANPDYVIVGGVYLASFTGFTAPIRRAFGYPGSTAGCPFNATATTPVSCLHVDVHALGFDRNRRLWLGSDGGSWRSDDLGSTFLNRNFDLGSTQIYGISGSLTTKLTAGMQDNGSAQRSGAGWAMHGYGDGGYSVTMSNGVALLSNQYLSLQKVTAAGTCPVTATFGESSGLSHYLSVDPFISPMIKATTNDTVFAGTSRVWKSTTAAGGCGSTTWTPMSPFFTHLDGAGGTVYEATSALGSSADGSVVYAATRAGNVYSSAKSWGLAESGLPNRVVTDFWVNPTNASSVIATVSGFGTSHVWFTTDGGSSWSSMGAGLPDSPANAITVDQRQNPAIVYVGTDAGVFWTNDGGAVWNNTSLDLPASIVNDLLLDVPSNTLIAATYGRGAWGATPIGASATSGPANDDASTPANVTALPYSNSLNTSTASNAEPLDSALCADFSGKTVWYRYTPSTTVSVNADTANSDFDTVLAVFRGSSANALNAIACDDDGLAPNGQGPSAIKSLLLTGGQTYWFQAGGYRQTLQDVPASGSLQFHLTAAGPVNDTFVGAAAITALPTSKSGMDTSLAQTETGENVAPTCTDGIGATVWYRYSPSTNVIVTADTGGSNYDTVLRAFDGTNLAALTQVGCDDDGLASGGGGASRIADLALTAGKTYYFQVGGYRTSATVAAATGSLSFRLSTASTSTDVFAGAATIGSLPFAPSPYSNINATVEPGENTVPTCTDGIGATTWFRYTPSSTGNVTFDTGGSTFDTVLVLWRGTTLTGLSSVACDDDGIASGGASRLASVPLTAGQTYYLQVGGYKSATGTAATGTVSVHATPG